MRLGRIGHVINSTLEVLDVVCRDRVLRGDIRFMDGGFGGVATTLLQSELSPLVDGLIEPEQSDIGDGSKHGEEEDLEERDDLECP